MAIVKDWMKEAQREIQESTGDLQNTEIREIIARYCPMKDEIAYMPVPRCETCKHWGGNEDKDGWRECHNRKDIDSEISEIMTAPDFGCVRWEAR